MEHNSGGLIQQLTELFGGGTTLIIAGIAGRLMYIGNEVRQKRRKFFALETIWEIPIVLGTALVGEGLSSQMGLSREATAAMVALAGYYGPRFFEFVVEKWFKANGK